MQVGEKGITHQDSKLISRYFRYSKNEAAVLATARNYGNPDPSSANFFAPIGLRRIIEEGEKFTHPRRRWNQFGSRCDRARASRDNCRNRQVLLLLILSWSMLRSPTWFRRSDFASIKNSDPRPRLFDKVPSLVFGIGSDSSKQSLHFHVLLVPPTIFSLRKVLFLVRFENR